MTDRVRWSQRGSSLVELVVAGGLFMVLVSSLIATFQGVDTSLSTEAERGDMQQRARAAFDGLREALSTAGVIGSSQPSGPSVLIVPPVIPRRLGLRDADPPGAFRRNAVTILSPLPLPAVTTTLAQPMPARADVTRVQHGPGCPPFDVACGLRADRDVIIADGHGMFGVFTVIDVTAPLVHLRHNGPDTADMYPPGSAVVPVAVRTLFWREADGGRPPQLVRYEGGTGPDAPMVDHVVSVAFEYFGLPEPARMIRPLSDLAGPWTTYGPAPEGDLSVIPAVAGTNCLFAANGSPLATPRLATLGAVGGPLIPLTDSQLSDGPWCPDETSPNRFDADLLRVRSIAFTIRIESALDALRGPAGVLFARAGTARAGSRLIPDIELRGRVTPAQMRGGR